MIRTLLLASALSLAAGGVALAQSDDNFWTGPYFGLHAGGTLRNETVRTTGALGNNITGLTSGRRPEFTTLNRNGWLGGGQIGYDRQMGRFVAGIEADASAMSANGSNTYWNPPGSGAARPSYTSAKLDYLGTVRGRLGYLMSPRALLYVTGGYAYGDPKYREVFGTPTGGTSYSGYHQYTAGGTAVGAGVEFALPVSFLGSKALTLQTEYLHYDLGRKDVNVAAAPGVGVGGFTGHFQTVGDELRAGLNLRF